MFIRAKSDCHGHRRHQLVRSVRTGGAVRQEIVAYLGDAPSVTAALRQWRTRIASLRQRAAELRSQAERFRAQMPQGWVQDGVVPRPSRYGMRAANKAFGRYWSTWASSEKLDRAADRLERRLDRLRDSVKRQLGTTPEDDEALDREA